MPAATPVTTPVVLSIVAILVLLLLHVPPVVVWLSVAVNPAQAVLVPVIAAGVASTVTCVIV